MSKVANWTLGSCAALVGVVWLIAVNADSDEPVAAEPEVSAAVTQAPAAAPVLAATPPASAAVETAVPGELASKYPVQSRSEEHTSELQSLMRISYAVFCLKKKKQKITILN